MGKSYFRQMMTGKKKFMTASLIQSSVSHDPSEIILICWFDAQSMLRRVVLLNIFIKTEFSLDSLINTNPLLSFLINSMNSYW